MLTSQEFHWNLGHGNLQNISPIVVNLCDIYNCQQDHEAKHVMLLTLWDPMDCSPPVSSVHGISQARILEWVTISSSRGSSRPRDQTHVACIGRHSLYRLSHVLFLAHQVKN